MVALFAVALMEGIDWRSAKFHTLVSNFSKLSSDPSSSPPCLVDSVIVERASLAMKLGMRHM